MSDMSLKCSKDWFSAGFLQQSQYNGYRDKTRDKDLAVFVTQ